MSQAELLVPEVATDETLVERFIEASRDIVPTVQISLAKRFVTPGSNRVVCLAAHTTFPLNPEEAASVSDLALRLSDGTNVRLSLSFFNDSAAGAEYVPYTSSYTRNSFEQATYARNIYDPDSYEVRNRSGGLPAVLACLLGLGAGGYWFFNHGFGLLNDLKAQIAAIKIPAKSQPAIMTAHALAPVYLPQPRIISEPSAQPKAHRAHKEHFRSANPSGPVIFPAANYSSSGLAPKTRGSNHAPRESFIPPPPPMALPLSPGQMPTYDFGNFTLVPVQKSTPGSSAVKPSTPNTAPIVSKSAPKAQEMISNSSVKPIAVPASFATVQAKSKATMTPNVVSEYSSKSQAKSAPDPNQNQNQYAKHSSADERYVKRYDGESQPPQAAADFLQRTQQNYSGTAPVPGDADSTVQLERIVPIPQN